MVGEELKGGEKGTLRYESCMENDGIGGRL